MKSVIHRSTIKATGQAKGVTLEVDIRLPSIVQAVTMLEEITELANAAFKPTSVRESYPRASTTEDTQVQVDSAKESEALEEVVNDKLYTNEDLMKAASEVAVKHSPQLVMQVLMEDFGVDTVNMVPQARRGEFIKTMATELESEE